MMTNFKEINSIQRKALLVYEPFKCLYFAESGFTLLFYYVHSRHEEGHQEGHNTREN